MKLCRGIHFDMHTLQNIGIALRVSQQFHFSLIFKGSISFSFLKPVQPLQGALTLCGATNSPLWWNPSLVDMRSERLQG